MQNSTKALFWVMLVFVIGALFGAVVVRLSLRSLLIADNARESSIQAEPPAQPLSSSARPSGPAQADRPSRPVVRDSALPDEALDNMRRRLRLNAEQERQAREILERARSEYATVEERRNLAQRRIRQEALRELREILNPRQRRQLRQFLYQLQERRRRGNP